MIYIFAIQLVSKRTLQGLVEESTTGRVKALVAQLGFDELRHHIDQHTRGKVLTGTGLLLVGVFLQKAFIQVAQAFLFSLIPVQLINLDVYKRQG